MSFPVMAISTSWVAGCAFWGQFQKTLTLQRYGTTTGLSSCNLLVLSLIDHGQARPSPGSFFIPIRNYPYTNLSVIPLALCLKSSIALRFFIPQDFFSINIIEISHCAFHKNFADLVTICTFNPGMVPFLFCLNMSFYLLPAQEMQPVLRRRMQACRAEKRFSKNEMLLVFIGHQKPDCASSKNCGFPVIFGFRFSCPD